MITVHMRNSKVLIPKGHTITGWKYATLKWCILSDENVVLHGSNSLPELEEFLSSPLGEGYQKFPVELCEVYSGGGINAERYPIFGEEKPTTFDGWLVDFTEQNLPS